MFVFWGGYLEQLLDWFERLRGRRCWQPGDEIFPGKQQSPALGERDGALCTATSRCTVATSQID